MSYPCNDTDIKLSIPSYDIVLQEQGKIIAKEDFCCKHTYISKDSYAYTDPVYVWSVISQPTFHVQRLTKYKQLENFILCEKSATHTPVFTNCSELYMSCNDGTCVHDSLVCDGQPHCHHGEDETDCQHICSDHRHDCMSRCHHNDLCSCSPYYFQCLLGGCVPLHKLCDKTVHCVDASDEPPTCVYLRPEQLGLPSLSLDINNYINMLIQQNMGIQNECSQFRDGLLVSVQSVNYKMHFDEQKCLPSSLSPDMQYLCSVIDLPYSATKHYFYLDRLCIYDHDCDDNYIFLCLNGFHLLKCEHMYCVGRFKCPSSYCISFDHICNKICDCLQSVRMKTSATIYYVQAWCS